MQKSQYIERLLENKILKYSKTFPAVVLTGPRQSGKSTTLKRLFSKTHQYLTFDDPVMRQKCVEDPKLFIDNLKEYVILDEIQYVPQILSYIKMSIDNNRTKYGRFIITGSQQFNLIKGLGDSLAGRAGILYLLPFNYNELSKRAQFKKHLSNSQNAFLFFCLRGSFPEVLVRKDLDPFEWYANYMQTYLERDVRGLHNVGNLLEFHRFIQLIAARCAQIVNLSALANDLGVAVNTVKSWISILIASQIIFLIPPYINNLGKRIIKGPKIYFTDCGLAAYLAGLRTKENILSGFMSGALFENYIISETYKILISMGKTPDLFYYRTHKGIEVDLINETNNEIMVSEIKLTKTPKSTMASNVIQFFNNLKTKKNHYGNVICMNEEIIPLAKGINAVSAINYFGEII